MSTQTITEFLEARIDEDEVFAAAPPRRFGHEVHLSDPIGTYSPRCPTCVGVHGGERMKAECAAKRAIIEMHREATREGYDNAAAYLWDALYALASVYADHADYRQEWAL